MNEQTIPHVNVVEASAGSGKTYELARRYIRLLLRSPSGPDAQARSTLAITFTNKASIEMKERILELLKKLALGKFSGSTEEKLLLEFLGMEKEPARKAAFAALESIIRNYNFFQIQTIDSFINAILSGCAFRLDLAANFKIKTDCSHHIAFGLDSLIEKAAEDEKCRGLFLDFLRQYIFLENKAGWFPKRELLKALSMLYMDSNAYGGNFLTYPGGRDALYEKRGAIVSMMKQLRDNEPSGANQVVFKSFRQRMEKFSEALNIDELAKPFCAELLPLRKNQEAPDEIKQLWQDIRREIGGLFEMESLSIFNCYIGIFEKVNAELRRAAAEENLMFLPELNRKARMLFDNGITVPELYYRLAARFRNYLIDEFQDTSRLQWSNLYLMLEEALSTGGSLFYVGDKKQAIFRFRGGDASLFRSAAAGFNRFSVAVDYLSSNYRSKKEIVDFNNAVFSQDNLRRFLEERAEWERSKDNEVPLSEQDTADVLDIFKESGQSSVPGPGGCVRVVPIEAEGGEEAENETREKLIELLYSLKERQGSYRDIAIISRANQDIEKVTAWLLEAKIPVESEKTLNIREHPLIKELVSLLTFLDSPIDNLSFASFIIGDIFSAASKLSKEEIHGFLFTHTASGKKKETGYLYRDFRARYPEGWGLLEEFFRNIGFVPLYELLVSIYSRFNICANFPASQGFLMKFLELAREQVSEENADCASFLEFFAEAPDAELYVNVAETEAVKVMSIHKAKGLGFSTVIIPFLEISVDVSGKEGAGYLIDEIPEGVRLLRLAKSHIPFSSHLSKLYAAEYKRLLIDELNTVYVALTRAKSALYGFLPAKSSRALNYARLLIPKELYEAGNEAAGCATPRQTAIQRMLVGPSEYKSWIHYLKEEFIDKSEVQNRAKILDGKVIHAALSFIGPAFAGNTDDAVGPAISRCRSIFPLYRNFARVERQLREIIACPRLRDFFVTDGKILCEQEIADRFGSVHRIDRLIETADGITLVDYKSSRGERERGIAQLAGYRDLAAEAFKKPVRSFLLYLDSLELEETHGNG